MGGRDTISSPIAAPHCGGNGVLSGFDTRKPPAGAGRSGLTGRRAGYDHAEGADAIGG